LLLLLLERLSSSLLFRLLERERLLAERSPEDRLLRPDSWSLSSSESYELELRERSPEERPL